MWIRQNIYMNLPNHLGIVVTVHAKKNEAQKLKRILLVRRQSFYNNQPKKYPWYLEIEVTKNEKKEKSCINMTDEGFFTFMNRIHRFIDCFVTAYSTNIMKMKFNNEQNWKQNKN